MSAMWAYSFFLPMAYVLAQRSPFELQPDGQASDPRVYRLASRRDKAWMKQLKKGCKRCWELIKSDDDKDIPELQKMLIKWFEARNGHPGEEYDDIGELGGLWEVKYDDGTIGEMAMLKPRLTDWERNFSKGFPSHMHCRACNAISYQTAHQIREALNKGDFGKRQQIMIDTIRTMCNNVSGWAGDYGIQAGKSGVNLLVGPGIPLSKDNYNEKDRKVNVETQHAKGWGLRFHWMCTRIIGMSNIQGPELVDILIKNKGEEGLPTVVKEFHKLLCMKEGFPCYKPPKKKKIVKKKCSGPDCKASKAKGSKKAVTAEL